MAKDYQNRISGDFACLDFSVLESAAERGCPEEFRNMEFMVTGPFVMRTEGALETEYLYEREKILEPDYLSGFGGETEVAPFYGLRGENPFMGCETAVWTRGIYKWDTLLFEAEDSEVICDGALYLTEQRNCVCYAAVYVRCEGEKRAVICYENSGCRLFLNGRLISDTPYGRVKGITATGELVPVTFEDGLNLLLFKLRPGYICDAVDFSMKYCFIHPVAAESGPAVLTHPVRTSMFREAETGTKQIFPCFVGAFADAGQVRVSVDGVQELELGDLRRGECRLVRAELPAENGTVTVPVGIRTADSPEGRGFFVGRTEGPPAFRGEELVTTSFHFDTTYHEEQRLYALGAIYITRELLKAMRRDPCFKAIFSEVDYLHPYYSISFEDREYLKEVFARGQAEPDCFYNQPSEMTSSGEGIVRNLVYGQLYHRDVMGRICDVYSPGDVFGHFNQMSQLAAKGGCGGIYWGKHIFGFWPAFAHMSPDGTSLIHRRGDITRSIASEMGLSFCGYDGGAMNCISGCPADGDLSWMEETVPAARFSLPSETRAAADRDAARARERGEPSPFELTSRDMSLYHAGCALTRTDLKQANRLGENLLITAEKLSVIAALNGAEYPELALDKAWRQLLCGQHHDSVTGTNNEISFVDLMIEYREAVELAADICDRAGKYIASRVRAFGRGFKVLLFNPHTWDRREHSTLTLETDRPFGAVSLTLPSGEPADWEILSQVGENGRWKTELTLTVSVPACGYTCCYVEPVGSGAPELPVRDLGNVIENEFYRITVDPKRGGGIVSLFDKELGREFIDPGADGPANRIAALKETHDRMETQHEFFTTGHKLLSDWEEAEVSRTVGRESSALTVRFSLGNLCEVTQEIVLRRGERRIDLETRLADYRDEDDLFTVTFPTTLKGVRPVFDDRFAPQVRTSSRGALSFRTHQMCMASHCAVYSANQWMDYGPGVTLLLKEGEKTGEINLGMTQLIRARDGALADAAEGLLTALTKKAVPVTPFPDRVQRVSGSQIPHFNEDLSSDTRFVLSVEGIEDLYERSLAERYPCAYARLKEASAEHAAAAYFTDRENRWGKPIDVILVRAPSVSELRLWTEGLARELENGHRVSVDAVLGDEPGPADDCGLGLINTGNIACSVEKGGMLNLMLFHTAEFYGNIGKTNCGKRLVPEHKSHVFTYSLLPHGGSYREAGLYRRALEKNDPIMVFSGADTAEDAFMPESFSLLRSEEGIVVTSVKAGGYPLASMKGEHGDIMTRGIALRFFEERGVSGTARLETGIRLRSAAVTNLLEEEPKPLVPGTDGALCPELTPHTVETVLLMPESAVVGKAVIGPCREAAEPTYVRSWEHDLGSMPMGYLSLCGIIDRDPVTLDEDRFSVRVAVSNNHTDVSVSGTARLILPGGWSADVTELPYELLPGGCSVTEVTVTKPFPGAKGVLRLEYSHGGQLFHDIFEVGYHDPTLNVELRGDTVAVTVANDTDQPLMGELYLASPIETWGAMGGKNPFGRTDIGPGVLPVRLDAHSRREYCFPCRGDRSASFWAVAKLAVNGRLRFGGVMHRPLQPHVLWAHRFIDEIIADNGSLDRLNAMK